MATFDEKIKEIEDEIQKTPKNKGTEGHLGLLKAKLARLKEQQEVSAAKSGAPGLGYGLKKAGDATVVLVGYPSVGKSTLLNQLTNAESKIGAYEFTTLNVIPGVMDYNNLKIQVWDVPGLIKGASKGKGRGKEVLSVVRSADLILIMCDVNHLKQADIIKQELYNSGIRLNKEPPEIYIKKKSSGGITINSTLKLDLSENLIKNVLREYGFSNCDVLIKENPDLERLIDAMLGTRVYMHMLVVLNKIDMSKETPKINEDFVAISAKNKENVEELKRRIFEKLNLIRIYTKPLGKEVNFNEPMIMKKGTTVSDFAEKIHKDIKKELRYSLVWGTSVKFPGQRVSLKHVLHDGDVIQLH